MDVTKEDIQKAAVTEEDVSDGVKRRQMIHFQEKDEEPTANFMLRRMLFSKHLILIKKDENSLGVQLEDALMTETEQHENPKQRLFRHQIKYSLSFPLVSCLVLLPATLHHIVPGSVVV